ncbi:hypothetical protein [Streptomyces iconiensis]|uniref:Uncharacterized protein n=1 Tax=Streptomyces iconiensis TaxID=1384038 RepID=A0ABT6ZZR1_9ACTN|nr:hypothetical protein [Streptomyces iconiensis]MDJ1134322.1 hypothetical protein [Streptomyces iconiensis]
MPRPVFTRDAGPDFLLRAGDAVAAQVAGAERRVLAGQNHMAGPKVLAPALERSFLAVGQRGAARANARSPVGS